MTLHQESTPSITYLPAATSDIRLGLLERLGLPNRRAVAVRADELGLA